MMRQKRLSGIQWQYTKQGLLLAMAIVVISFSIGLLFLDYLNKTPTLLQWLGSFTGITQPLPLNWPIIAITFGLTLMIAALIGMISGYIAGNLLKKRMNILLQATMGLERGQLSHRAPELGEDELGVLASQFNRLAAKWEEQVASLQRLSNHNAALAEQLKQAAVVDERQRLARELHDAVSQQLFAIAMTTAAMKRLIVKNPERAAQQIELVEEMAAAAQSEMRALLLHLRPATLQDKTLREAMHELLSELKQKHNLNITWEIEQKTALPSGIEDHLFRILQEALSNSLRHAKANQLEVKLFSLPHQVRLRVADDGVGFDPDDEKMTSYGLLSIKERVTELGGTLEVYSARGKGTQIEVIVPLMTISEGEGEGFDDDPGTVG